MFGPPSIRYLFLASWGSWGRSGVDLGGIHASLIFDYAFQFMRKRPTQVILENHGCKFTHSRETSVKTTCVCVCVFFYRTAVGCKL
jgi:hypothetical protein